MDMKIKETDGQRSTGDGCCRGSAYGLGGVERALRAAGSVQGASYPAQLPHTAWCLATVMWCGVRPLVAAAFKPVLAAIAYLNHAQIYSSN